MVGTRFVSGMSVGVVALALGCNAPSTQSAHVSSPGPNPSIVSLTPLTATRVARELAPSQSLSLVLPEASLWQVGNDGTYYHAVHSETASELWVKRWRQGEVVSATRCAEQSALWRPHLAPPNVAGSETLNAVRVVHAPPEYRTQVNVAVWPDGETWRAQLTASGAAIRECFSYVYRTQAPRSPLGRAVVTQRLDVMREALDATRVTGATVDDVRQPAP